MQKHTPGPWHWVNKDGDYYELQNGDEIVVADDGSACGEYSSWFEGDSPDADALLIAAAPDLLAACQAQHKAIDILMAMLIETNTGFMPTKSVVWPAVVAGSAAILKATEGKS